MPGLGFEEQMEIDLILNVLHAEQAENMVTKALKSIGSSATLTAEQVKEMASTMDPKIFGEFSKESSLMQINLRDFRSSMVIQAQKIKQFRDELEAGFFAFERTTQQITVLDASLRGNRDAVAAFAFELGANFDITAEDAALALKDVMKMGIGFQEATQLMTVAAEGAAAGMGTIQNASELLVIASRQFGLSMDDSVVTMAKIVKIADETRINIDDLRGSLALAGPEAASLGFTMDETAAAIGVLRDAGLEAFQAGSALRSFMTKLQDPTSQARVLMDDLGISTTDASGNFLSLSQILQNVADGTKGLTTEEQALVSAQLFGVRGQQLLNVIRTEGKDKLDQLISATSDLNNKSAAQAFLTDKSNQALDTQAKAMNASQERAKEINFTFANKLIPSEILLLDTTTNIKKAFVDLDPAIANSIGALTVFGGAIMNSIGQGTLLIVNLITISKTIKGASTALEDITQAQKHAGEAALGLGFAIGGTITALEALRTQDSGTRAVLIALTGLQWGLAFASFAAAAGMSGAQMGLAGLIGAGIAIAALFVLISAGIGQAQSTAAKFAAGGLVPAKPGVGILAQIGEGYSPEIVSPVPMMKETFREGIREQGGGVQGVTSH